MRIAQSTVRSSRERAGTARCDTPCTGSSHRGLEKVPGNVGGGDSREFFFSGQPVWTAALPPKSNL
ncbi:hypothetical protein B0T16DRAFT_396700, partial [Cercophora newfieldiana]